MDIGLNEGLTIVAHLTIESPKCLDTVSRS